MPAFQYFKRFVQARGYVTSRTAGIDATTACNVDVFLPTTGTMIANRVVRLSTNGELAHTTGTSGRRVFGVLLSTGSTARVRIAGIVDVEVSSAAVTKGRPLRATSGAVASTSRLGGTVRARSTPSTTLNRQWICGVSLTSAAAGTGKRTIKMFLTPQGVGSTEA